MGKFLDQLLRMLTYVPVDPGSRWGGAMSRDPGKVGLEKEDQLGSQNDFMLLDPSPTEFLFLTLFACQIFPSLSIAGTLRDVTGNWKASYYYCSSTLVFATAVMILSQFYLTRKKDKMSHKHYQIETQDTNQ